jgi:hypothetical protein
MFLLGYICQLTIVVQLKRVLLLINSRASLHFNFRGGQVVSGLPLLKKKSSLPYAQYV